MAKQNTIVNSVYDLSYFDAEGNEYYSRKSNNFLWWASSDRETGSDFIEIDLGKPRGINYISFDIMRSPIDIQIQYDKIDLNSAGLYPDPYDRRWEVVKKIDNAAFDSSIAYNSDYSNPWKHAEFFFTDAKGEFLIARRLRIKFTRRDDNWPSPTFKKFRFGSHVKNLRVARYITERTHLRGVLFGADTFNNSRKFTDEVRQNIVVPSTHEVVPTSTTDLTAIDGFLPQKIYPRIAQFNFLVTPNDVTQSAAFQWALFDTTNYELPLVNGIKNWRFSTSSPAALSGDVGDGPSNTVPLPEWVKITLPEEIEVRSNRTYQMRIRNLNTAACSEYYVTSPSLNASGADSSSVDLYETNASGGFNQVTNTSMTYQIVANIGASGKDLLGNEYREAVRYYDAERAVDKAKTTSWTCFPNPSPDGVEALYLDVRQVVDGVNQPSVIDSMAVGTLTPGVFMNVYYSEQQVEGTPDEVDEWESILWTPMRESYRLGQSDIIDFPYPIKANWICLEFYGLQPMPMELPNYPILPEVPYKEFPQWVIEDSKTTIVVNDEASLEKEEFVSFTVPELVASDVENETGLRVYADKPYTMEENHKSNGFGYAEPKLLSKISLSRNAYAQPSITRVDTSSLLGSNVFESYSTDSLKTFSSEATVYPRIVNTRSVSNTNDRFEFSRTEFAESSLLFGRVCAHQYAVKRARYNKKAYFVSISEVEFTRKDYSVEYDDPIVHDMLVYQSAQESPFVDYSTWEPEQRVSIPLGGSLFVTYEINGKEYIDQLVTFEPFDSTEPSFQPVDLPGSGGMALGTIARSAPFGGGQTYYRNQDFVIVYDAVSKKNSIQRNDIPARLVIGQITNAVDKFTVTGSSVMVTEVDGGDIVELGDKGSVSALSAGSSTASLLIVFGLGEAEIRSETTIYATLDDD